MRHYSTKELFEINNKAPLSVQEALSSITTITTISNLGDKFKLHVDQIGLVAELNVQMLLGLVGPEEFIKELVAVGIPDMSAKQIIAEINQKIFVPLREQLRRQTGSEPRPQASGIQSGGGSQQPTSAAPQAPRVMPPTPPRPASMPVPKFYAPPPQSPSYTRPDNQFTPSPLVSRIAPLPPKAILPRAPEAPSVEAPLVLNGGGQASVNLIERKPEIHHELPPPPPVPAAATPTPLPTSSAETPLQQALRTVLPRPSVASGGVGPPSNLPGALPPSDIIPPTPKTPPAPSTSGVDPYREPIEEGGR